MTKLSQPGLAAKKYIEELILPSDPLRPLWNRENLIFRKIPKWNYIDNCMMTALLTIYETSGDERLLAYAVRFIGAYMDSRGGIPTLCPDDFNLDNINGGKNLLRLARLTGREIYLTAAEELINGQLARQPRLACGNFWHKAIYPHQIWLDGTYMALPFMAEYGLLTCRPELIEDVCSQLRNIRKLMRDPVTGLYCHGYDETKSMNWADPETGLSQEFWLRAMGWMSAALADLAELVPEEPLFGEMLTDLLSSLSAAALEDGMLLQLPMHPEIEDNYPETSGTLLFAYSALKASRLGICGHELREAGSRALCTVTDKYITSDSQGIPVLGNICLMAGLGPGRDGSAEYYLSEKIVENDAKGIAPFLMACNELELIPE